MVLTECEDGLLNDLALCITFVTVVALLLLLAFLLLVLMIVSFFHLVAVVAHRHLLMRVARVSVEKLTVRAVGRCKCRRNSTQEIDKAVCNKTFINSLTLHRLTRIYLPRGFGVLGFWGFGVLGEGFGFYT